MAALRLVDHIRAGDVRRHEVGRELDAFERQHHDPRDGRDHERLGQARHADEQAVAARKNGGKDLVEYRPLADDNLFDLLDDAVIASFEALQQDGIRFFGHQGIPRLRLPSLQTVLLY